MNDLSENINIFTGAQFSNIKNGYNALIQKINGLKQFLDQMTPMITQNK